MPSGLSPGSCHYSITPLLPSLTLKAVLLIPHCLELFLVPFASDIETWVLRLLSQIKQIPRKEVIHLLASTYGGYLASRQHPDWHKVTQPRLEEFLTKMDYLGLLEEEDEQIRLSLLGQACGRSNFSFSSALKLVDLLKRFPENLSAEQLMAYLQVLPEVAGYISVSKKGTKESTWAHQINTYYGDAVTAGFQRGAKDKFDYYGRCKRAAILWDWINRQPIESIEKKFSVTSYAGNVGASNIRGCADRTRLYLQSTHDIVSILLLGEGPDEFAINALLQQLEFGLPINALDLINLPVNLSRGEYLALYQAGYITSKEVLQSSEKLYPLLGELRIKQLMGET